MKTHEREILIFYNPESSSDRRTVAHAQGLTPHVRTYEFGKHPSTTTIWRRILVALNVHPKDLMNKAHPYYQSNIKGRDFDDEGWLNVLERNPQLMKAPIAMKGSKAVLCLNPTDIYQLTGRGTSSNS
jgi:arsenate reductase